MSYLAPARDYIILKLEETKYTGSLIIPESAKDAPSIGIVTHVGPGPWSSDMSEPEMLMTKVGDRVLFAKYSGADFEWKGEKLLLLRESEIICYIVDDE